MRGGNKGRIAIVASGALAIAMGLIVERSAPPSGSSSGYRLVSIQEIPDQAEICLPQESGSADSNLIAAFEQSDENRILDLLRGRSVHAASQEGQTVELNREPIRRLWDTDPSYGSIAF